MLRRAALSAPLLALALIGAGPDVSRDELERLEAEKAAAEARLQALVDARDWAERDLGDVDARLIAAAMESRRREEQATIAERRLIDLEARRGSLQASLLADRDNLDALLGALALSSAQRPPAMVTRPEDATTAIRASIVMGVMAPELKSRTDKLTGELRKLERIEADLRKERARLAAAEAILAEKREEIEQLAAAKRARFADIAGEADALRQQVDALAERAETIGQLLATLEAAAPVAPRTKPQPPQFAALDTAPQETARPDPVIRPRRPLDNAVLGGLMKPATGLLALKYGETLATGTKSEGLYIETRGQAQVVAPVDGEIVYAGTFRSYGEMLILRTSDGYHVILSGLRRIYGSKGQWVSAGEPVGRMPGRASPPPELYLEVRKDGRAMDPSKWMKG